MSNEERAAFEAWASTQVGSTDPAENRRTIIDAWRGWEARAALAAQQVPATDERSLIRRVDAQLSAAGLESHTDTHTSRYRLLVAVREFLAVCPGHLPEWLLPVAQKMREATELAAPQAQAVPRWLSDDEIAAISLECSLSTPSDIYFAQEILRAAGVKEPGNA